MFVAISRCASFDGHGKDDRRFVWAITANEEKEKKTNRGKTNGKETGKKNVERHARNAEITTVLGLGTLV